MKASNSIYGNYKDMLAEIAKVDDAKTNYEKAFEEDKTADDKLAANVKAIEDTWAEIAA
jgi:hypothetical protein